MFGRLFRAGKETLLSEKKTLLFCGKYERLGKVQSHQNYALSPSSFSSLFYVVVITV